MATSLFLSHVARPDLAFLAYVSVLSFLAYCLGRPLVKFAHALLYPDDQKASYQNSGLDQAEKGGLQKQDEMTDEDIFQLEKRAFFSKTWLFVCHRSRFDKPGDYHAFDIAGISFFVVLGKDLQLRAFHNICRHRAYTVVRKPCGTSTRFSCKYHGWQYDDEGRLVKAPKFDESPGFVPEDNGLFEVKLITTREGLVFANFDASTMKLPFNNVKSHVDLGSCSYVDGVSVTCATNWKDIANDFSSQCQWSQNPFGWFPRLRKQKMATLLGPLSMVKELRAGLWCTMTLLPRSPTEVVVRCDLYARKGYQVPARVVEQQKWMLEKELLNLSKPDTSDKSSRTPFAYQCGGRTIDLFAILAQHERNEKLAKKKLQPAIRITSSAEIDEEAAAICDAIDGMDETTSLEKCSKISSFPQTLEW
ncbi:hypothetical protein A1O1_06459 [Capronia coronata CBS 617.96]|uniref:Rieske domain-containing protein n=1 Tax=Capronia coronata CBS 617.96 TaxID=1182541 RepID=W9Y8X5_9EURO|nr:uncharacterized protein A1O1_06459 [Capronia coronata CBS 617.96]EXJ86090.1 hypothetical protein A1O1_06459 [Capronia coronata CBS 617.96]